jgi:tRNA A37 threonylcarbamoyladenosine modification protein TsaB
MGIPTLDMIAAAQPVAKHPLVAVLQAGRTRIAFSVYKSDKKEWQAEGGVRSGTVDELLNEIESPTLVAGELTSEIERRSRK